MLIFYQRTLDNNHWCCNMNFKKSTHKKHPGAVGAFNVEDISLLVTYGSQKISLSKFHFEADLGRLLKMLS